MLCLISQQPSWIFPVTMRVCTLLLVMVTASPLTLAADDTGAYSSGDHSGGDYASVQASQGKGRGGGGGGGVVYRTGGAGRGGQGPGGAGRGGQGNGVHVGSVSTLDSFGDTFGGAGLDTSFQRGTAQVNWRDRSVTRAQEVDRQKARDVDNADVGATRADDQDRRSQLKESAYNSQDQQSQGSGSQESGAQQKAYDRGSERGQKQIDIKDKHGSSLQSDGRYNRKDLAANAGNKALSASKTAFTTLDNNFSNINYGYKKNFNNNFNERGGSRDSVGKDNTHSDVYEENQKDSRVSKAIRDAIRRSNGDNAFRKESDWRSNATQAHNLNNRYGAADRLQNAANQNNTDFNALFDRRNDVFWHRDTAQDQAVRQANDQARQQADQQKNAVAEASGSKGVRDSKYYGGGAYGQGAGSSAGGSFPIVGHSGTGSQAGTAGYPYGDSGSGPIVSGGLAQGGTIVGRDPGSPGQGKGRQEGSEGTYLNRYGEKALQSDQGGQKEASQALSDARALNDYSEGRGVDDSKELRGQRQGAWATDRSGLRDALAQGFNGANADASRKAGLADRSVDVRQSRSDLDAANKNLQAQKVDRINYKRNQVDSNRRVRNQRKFYHDKKEDGNNDEALNFNRGEGGQRAGEEQQARREARNSYSNAAADAKLSQQGRAYSNLDGRQVSLADAFSRQKDAAGGWKNSDQQAEAQAQKLKAAADSGRQNSELDTFGQNLSSRRRQLWDKGQQSQVSKDQAQERDRALNALFQFGPLRSDSALGLGGERGTGGGGSNFRSIVQRPQTFGGGSTGFGARSAPISSFGASGFGGSSLGGSKFGGSASSGSGSSGGKFGGSSLGSRSFGGSNSGGGKFGGSSLGSSSFGGSSSGGSKFGGSSSGGSKFGGSSSGGSKFGGGSSFDGGAFASPLGGFMDSMGAGKFGQFSFGQSPSGAHSASAGFSGSSPNDRLWNDK